jgi:hypothetical protein
MKGVPVGGSGRQREALCKLARCEARSCRGSRPIKSIDAPAPTPANSADTTPTGKVPMRVVAHRCVAIAQRGAGGLWTFVGCRDIESAQLAEPICPRILSGGHTRSSMLMRSWFGWKYTSSPVMSFSRRRRIRSRYSCNNTIHLVISGFNMVLTIQ